MKRDLQQRAISLRETGASIGNIATTLDISRSTASRWCKTVELSEKQKASLETQRKEAGLAALSPWIERNRKLKSDDLLFQAANGKEDVGVVSERDLFMLGLGLYWGEGYKRGSQECGFTNSDPSIIRTILKWFRVCYGVGMDRINARLTINERYKSEASRITREWSEHAGIPIAQFSTPTFITGYGKPSGDRSTYTGTLRIKVRNGTSLRRRILASLAAVED